MGGSGDGVIGRISEGLKNCGRSGERKKVIENNKRVKILD
jgi:hypothetical protein